MAFLNRLGLMLAICAWPLATRADPPRVLVDIPPIHSITARVMRDVAKPELLMPPGTSPHHYSLRPSEARRLQDAELVIWVGPDLTPWLAAPIASLASEATVIEAMAIDGIRLRPFADAHDHGHETDAHGHEDGHAHDPHIWLDPENAVKIAAETASVLSELDPANAAAYQANRAQFEDEIRQLSSRLVDVLKPIGDRSYIVFHDAYGYFEDRFGLAHAGALSLGDADKPGAGRIRDIANLIRDKQVVCVFSEPQFSARLVETVVEGTDARTETLDPLGASLTQGETLYPALLEGLALSFSACLAPPK